MGLNPSEAWWRSAVLYQVYARSFADADGDGVGDLEGIAGHLDHLRGTPDSLGVDGIWLSPIYPSPQADFGYDISDHCGIDPVYGDLAAFDRLVTGAHGRGLRVLMDLVPSHTSEEHPWFRAARRSRRDPLRALYIWADPAPDGGPPNNWTAAFGGSAWELDEPSGQYYLHSFYREQPDLNWRSPAVHERLGEVVRFWLQRGVDGFRVDAIDRSIKDLRLRDNPPVPPGYEGRFLSVQGQLHIWNKSRPETLDVVRSLRTATESVRPDAMLLGEAYVPIETLGRYFGTADRPGFHLAFDFGFIYAPWDAAWLRMAVDAAEAHLPDHAWPCRALSNHDNPRHGTRFGTAALRAAAVLELTLRGTPVLYMGEEIGMVDVESAPGAAFDRAGRDTSRTPMQWSAGPGGGFTLGKPWLPLGDTAAVNVADQRTDGSSLLALYRDLLRVRSASAALALGSHRSLDVPVESGVFAYLREAGAERMLVAVNCSSAPVTLDLVAAGHGRVEPSAQSSSSADQGPARPAFVLPTAPSLILSTVVDRTRGDGIDLRRMELTPNEAVIVRL